MVAFPHLNDVSQPGVRRAQIEDMPAILRLWRDCGLTRPWNDPEADLRRLFQCPGARVLVLGGEDGAPVGTVVAQWEGHRGWIGSLAVDPGVRGNGHGRTLVQAAEDWVRRQGAPAIQLMVREGNVDAEGFYDRLGYEALPVTVWQKRLDGTVRS